MQDRTPLYPGRVKLVPVEGQTNVYDMTREDSPTQPGTPMSKATFLKDATAALFGLGSDAVPDDALALLSRFHKELGNEYVWWKTKYETVALYDTAEKLGATDGVYLSQGSSSSYTETVYYSDSYTVNESTVTLNNPSSVKVGYNYLSNAEQLKGKYFINGAQSGTTVKFLPQDAVLSQFSYSPASNYALKADLYYEYSGFRNEEQHVSYGYVNSPDPSAYPPAVSDGYTYTALGKLGNKCSVEIVSYTGTGTYGESNPCRITFARKPKIIMLLGKMGSGQYWESYLGYDSNARTVQVVDCISGSYKIYNGLGHQSYSSLGRIIGDTYEWYNSDSADYQENKSGDVYYVGLFY